MSNSFSDILGTKDLETLSNDELISHWDFVSQACRAANWNLTGREWSYAETVFSALHARAQKQEKN